MSAAHHQAPRGVGGEVAAAAAADDASVPAVRTVAGVTAGVPHPLPVLLLERAHV